MAKADFDFQFSLKGMDDVIDRMKDLPSRVQRRTLRRAARRAMMPVRDAVKANAIRIDDPVTSEAIYRNVAIQEKSRESRKQGGVVMSVGIRGGASSYANTRANRRASRVGQSYETSGSKMNPGGDTFYWRFLEFGTQHAAAKPFVRPAWNITREQVPETFAREINTGIDEALKK